MYTFFHGWRRKAGVVSLVMACMLTAGWIRSLRMIDRIDLRWADDYSATVSLLSMEGCLGCMNGFQHDREISDRTEELLTHNLVTRFPEWHSYRIDGIMSPLPETSRFESPLAKWCWHHLRVGAGREVGVLAGGSFFRGTDWVVPYWLVVLPLTMLSAYLILWKPRKRT